MGNREIQPDLNCKIYLDFDHLKLKNNVASGRFSCDILVLLKTNKRREKYEKRTRNKRTLGNEMVY